MDDEADAADLQVVAEEGGVYLDLDAVVMRDLFTIPDLLKYEAVFGHQYGSLFMSELRC